MGGEVNVCNHLQAQAASRATRVPPVKRVSQVVGCSYHHRNPVLVLRFEGFSGISEMGGNVNVCNHLQAQAASRASRATLGATGQTGVTGGWTLLPLNEPSASFVPWWCYRDK